MIVKHSLIICQALAILLSSCGQTPAFSQEGVSEVVGGYSVQRLADAIYKAEGGSKTRHAYGILTKYKHTTPRQACLNSIRNQWKRHQAHDCHKDYLTCLRNRYCPVEAKNDPTNLNKNWLNNVRRLYNAS